MQKILTEAVLRSELIPAGTRSYTVSKDTVVTPTAREYLKKRGIELKTAPAGPGRSMSRTEIRENGSYTYVDAVTGKGYREKPEDMTHLRGNRLVKKSDPRIAFRGQLDSLEAHILECQAQVCEQGNAELCGCLANSWTMCGTFWARRCGTNRWRKSRCSDTTTTGCAMCRTM